MGSSSELPTGRPSQFPGAIPLVGRTAELGALESLLDGPKRPVSAVLVCGEGGSGKSRLTAELAARAERRGWTVAAGRAYPVERGVPYALFSDAFLPILREMDPDTLSVLSRGGEAELRYLFPALAREEERAPVVAPGDPEEFRTRLLWNFAEFLKSYSARTPLMLVLEDLHWADQSSLELLHFVIRQAAGEPIFVVATYNDSDRDRSPALVQMERSLLSLNTAMVRRLEPLTREDVTELVCRTFAVDAELVREFSAMLFGWTRGNPFFLEESLKSLVASGALVNRKGTWVGWDAKDFSLSASIRDAVLSELSALSDDAQAAVELAAVVGTRANYPLLASISGMDEAHLLAALEELCAHRVLTERADRGTVIYDFRHPLVRETLYQDFGLQRSRVLHGAVAEAMEAFWGDAAEDHADELAYHFARTDTAQLTPKAVRYLSVAGRAALERHADREAAGYLRAALDRAGSRSVGDAERDAVQGLRHDLARAHRRLGEYEAAAKLWAKCIQSVAPETSEYAEFLRNLGLATFWCGRAEEALDCLEKGLASAQAAGDPATEIQLRLARSHCYQELGRGTEARTEAEAALPLAETLGEADLLDGVHRSLALLHVWIGPPAVAEAHAEKAIALAQESGDLSVEFWARWGLAVLWGMTGDTEGMARGLDEATTLADRLRSPVLRLWTAEMSIELAYANGDWDSGVALGEQSIALARTLNQKALLPRLLVCTALFYVGRGDLDRSKTLVDEACDISGMHRKQGARDVHMVVPAYTGLAHYLVGIEQYGDAIAAARKGLEIAEGTGYTPWAVHRLLPILAEACLWAGEIDEAERVGAQMREHAQNRNHKLGLAWADAADALVRWKRGDPRGGAVAMREAAEALEEIPMIPYAARIRRQLAGRLAEIGDRDGAKGELDRVHHVFASLGAELELQKTRIQYREMDLRPPPIPADGVAGFTPRELAVARLVARRKSNKAIGKELGISPRTVSTHLSNIFKKMDLSSRAELGDLIRDEGLLEG